MEAVNANRPFVAMSNPYLTQITKSKFIGTIVHDNAEMTEAIENYLSDPSFKKENPERDRVLKEISAEKFGADVLKFYQQIINSFDPNGSKYSDEPTDEEIGYARQLLGRLPLPKVAKRKILKVKKEARDNK
nr:hypothetical protein [Oenococcus oeni]